MLKYAYAEDWTTQEAASLLKTTNLRRKVAESVEEVEGRVCL